MPDVFTPEERSRIMSRITSGNTAPERTVRSLLHRMGYRFRLRVRALPGSPDIVLRRHRAAILVHGCFWHGHKRCRRAARPATHRGFWKRKIEGNMRRDQKVMRKLRSLGWRVLVVWQCQTRNAVALEARLRRFFGPGKEDGK